MEGARERLLEIVSELESMVEMECIIPQKYHRNVLGIKGRNVQELTSRLNVQIKFPERRKSDVVEEESSDASEGDSKSDIIIISGKREHAEEAKDCLQVGLLVNLEWLGFVGCLFWHHNISVLSVSAFSIHDYI